MMNEFEYYQVFNMARSGVPNAAMDFIYLVFAYIIASYLAGKELPRFIAVAASTVYTIALIGPLFGVLIGISQAIQISSEYQLAFPEGGLLQGRVDSWFAYVIAVSPLIVGWLASILFLHIFIRGSKPKNEDSDT